MLCNPTGKAFIAVVIGGLAAMASTASTSFAQQPGAPTTPPVPYHAPVIVLSQPGDGGALPADKPVVVFRFSAGEGTDPIDALSFAVSVDGADRTDRFQMTNGEAWGTISDSSTSASGPYDVRARICSARGSCATVHGTVSTTAADQLATPALRASATVAKPASQRRTRSVIKVLDKVLQAARVLSRP